MPNMLPMLFCHLFDAIALRFFASVAIRDAQKTIADENYIYRMKIATKMAPLMSPRGIVGQNYIPNELVQRTVASNSCSQQIHLFTTTLTFKLLTPMAWIWSSNCFIKIEAEPITRNPVIVNACQGKKEFDFENIPLPVPEGIRGFSRIQISCLDEKVIRFLVQIKYLFKEGIILGLKNVHQIMPSLFADIWPIIKEDLYALSVDYHGLNFMRQCISNTVLTSCPKLRWIEASDLPDDDDSAETAENALWDWLHLPLSDPAKPKILQCRTNDSEGLQIEQTADIQTKFNNADTRCSYILVLANPLIEQNEHENLTDINNGIGECIKFELRANEDEDRDNWFLFHAVHLTQTTIGVRFTLKQVAL
ncbi:hypothetical protein niasHT_012486 [Heterodera trifolii]|uniref:Uncharacterized protein n=1 Tax=Heterodera trifolii TaxID=157864 RepID=A0ABD2KUQ4_9BILA